MGFLALTARRAHLLLNLLLLLGVAAFRAVVKVARKCLIVSVLSVMERVVCV